MCYNLQMLNILWVFQDCFRTVYWLYFFIIKHKSIEVILPLGN